MQKKICLKSCGILGMLASLLVIMSDIVGIVLHEKHDPISDTISMLAIGKYSWIQDWGIDIFALGFFAVAIGLFCFKNEGVKWILSLVLLVLIGVDFIFIAEHNQYAGRPGFTIHRKLVYALTALFLALTVLISFDLKKLHPSLKSFSLTVGALWLLMAPLFPVMPDYIDGAFERVVCLLLVVWLAVVSYNLYRHSRLD